MIAPNGHIYLLCQIHWWERETEVDPEQDRLTFVRNSSLSTGRGQRETEASGEDYNQPAAAWATTQWS